MFYLVGFFSILIPFSIHLVFLVHICNCFFSISLSPHSSFYSQIDACVIYFQKPFSKISFSRSLCPALLWGAHVYVNVNSHHHEFPRNECSQNKHPLVVGLRGYFILGTPCSKSITCGKRPMWKKIKKKNLMIFNKYHKGEKKKGMLFAFWNLTFYSWMTSLMIMDECFSW